jgi:hypothetical protein
METGQHWPTPRIAFVEAAATTGAAITIQRFACLDARCWPFTTVPTSARGLISYQFSDIPKRAATTSDVALPIALDHCSMRFVSAAVARSFVADVPARVVCFFLGIGASLLQKPRQGALAEACLQLPALGRVRRAAACGMKAPNAADVR